MELKFIYSIKTFKNVVHGKTKFYSYKLIFETILEVDQYTKCIAFFETITNKANKHTSLIY